MNCVITQVAIVAPPKEVTSRGKVYQYIAITGSHVKNSGFTSSEPLVASYEHGLITLQRLDFSKLGF